MNNKNKVLAPSIDDIQFLEACVEIKQNTIVALLNYIVDSGIEEGLIDYMEEWVEEDNEYLDGGNIDDVIEIIEKIKNT